MNVLKAIPYYYPESKFGGPPIKVHGLARHLVAGGASVRVLTFDSTDPHRSESITVDGVDVRYLPWRGSGLRQWPRDPDTINEALASCDVAHTYGLYNFIAPAVARRARERGIPYVSEPLGMRVPVGRNRGLKKLYNRLLGDPMLRRAAAVIATAPSEAESLQTQVPGCGVVVRANGIDTDAFCQRVDTGRLLGELGLDPQRPYILFLGRISPIKNLEALVTAFATADPAGTDLVLAGPANEPAYHDKVVRAVRATGMGGRIHLTGPVDGETKVALLQAAKLFVLPSLSESFGNAAGEAIAAGTPVVVTNGCGIAPLVDGRAGMVTSAEVDGLAGAITRMLGDTSFRRERSLGIGAVTAALSWDKPVQKMVAIYADATATAS